MISVVCLVQLGGYCPQPSLAFDKPKLFVRPCSAFVGGFCIREKLAVGQSTCFSVLPEYADQCLRVLLLGQQIAVRLYLS
jgi:hypothetical protein